MERAMLDGLIFDKDGTLFRLPDQLGPLGAGLSDGCMAEDAGHMPTGMGQAIGYRPRHQDVPRPTAR